MGGNIKVNTKVGEGTLTSFNFAELAPRIFPPINLLYRSEGVMEESYFMEEDYG